MCWKKRRRSTLSKKPCGDAPTGAALGPPSPGVEVQKILCWWRPKLPIAAMRATRANRTFSRHLTPRIMSVDRVPGVKMSNSGAPVREAMKPKCSRAPFFGRGGQAARAACGPHKGRKGGVKIAGDEQQQRPQAQVPAAERAARRSRNGPDRRAAPRKGRRRARAPPAFDAARRRRAAFAPPLCRPVGRRQDGDGNGLVRGLTRQLRAR